MVVTLNVLTTVSMHTHTHAHTHTHFFSFSKTSNVFKLLYKQTNKSIRVSIHDIVASNFMLMDKECFYVFFLIMHTDTLNGKTLSDGFQVFESVYG